MFVQCKFPKFFLTFDKEEDIKTPFCMYNVSFLFKIPSKSKTITENKSF